MLKRFLVLTYLLFQISSGYACDLCGCYVGVQPNLDNNFVGIRMRFRDFYGNVPHFHSLVDQPGPAVQTNDRFYTFELMGRYYFTPKLQFTIMLPYAYNHNQSGDEVNTLSGVSDPLLLLQYKLLSPKTNDCNNIKQVLFLGGGMKLPIGKSNLPYEDGDWEPHAQPGTGSYDFLLASNYLLRYKAYGINADVSYKLNTKSSNNFLYGNRFNATLHGFYSYEIKKITLMPFAGGYFENAPSDKLNGETYLNTGGSTLFASIGAEIFYKKFSVSFNYQVPALERLEGVQVPNHRRIVSGVKFFF